METLEQELDDMAAGMDYWKKLWKSNVLSTKSATNTGVYLELILTITVTQEESKIRCNKDL